MNKAVVPVVSVLVLFVMCGVTLYYMQTSARFDITKVRVKGHARLKPEMIVEELNLQPHTNIFQISLALLQQKLEGMTWVKAAKVYRNFPNKLTVDITERAPCALVKMNELHLVDEEGVVLGVLASGSAIRLPILTGAFIAEHVRPEGKNPELQQALQALIAFQASRHPLLQHIRKMSIDCLENVTVYGADATPVVQISLAEYQESLRRLEKIYPELQLERLAAIDLRFDKRIIITPKNS